VIKVTYKRNQKICRTEVRNKKLSDPFLFGPIILIPISTHDIEEEVVGVITTLNSVPPPISAYVEERDNASHLRVVNEPRIPPIKKFRSKGTLPKILLAFTTNLDATSKRIVNPRLLKNLLSRNKKLMKPVIRHLVLGRVRAIEI